MSAESPNRGGPGRTTYHKVVPPQQVTDPTILESVAGFISDVVPTSYYPCVDTEDQIQWANFETIESESNFDEISSLLLILGYSSGVQIWAIPANGDATEIAAWRCGNCRFLRILPNPKKSSNDVDHFAATRPLIALCDSITNYNTLVVRTLKAGVLDPVKQLQFHKQISNVYANKRSVIVTFCEKIALFDAFTLENRGTITTCHISPGLQINPIALGTRWLAFAEKKLNASCRSGGGCAGESTQSYTGTLIHAAKTFGRGIRDLTGSVTGTLTNSFKSGMLPTTHTNSQYGGTGGGGGTVSSGLNSPDAPQQGVISILDLEHHHRSTSITNREALIAHFVAHNEPIVHMAFDPSGMLLLTADRGGHNFHLFRIHPHPGGCHLAAVQHLYTLHRGDTSAKVQDMCFASDSRWVAVSTLRGTTHVFPITPYGGAVNVRTHSNVHVVNKYSRFQRSAGLAVEGRSFTPGSHLNKQQILSPYYNPRYPPFLQPTLNTPLAQIRQPLYVQSRMMVGTPHHQQSSSEDNITLRLVATFAPPRAWLEDAKTATESVNRSQPVSGSNRVVESLFIMSCNGTLLQYDLEPQPAPVSSKDRICNETAISLRACAKAQWMLQRQSDAKDVPLPVAEDLIGFVAQDGLNYKKTRMFETTDDHWLSQVEILTHMGPHRRLWMGPQFTFKTYTVANGSVVETRPVDIRRSKPINMPISKANAVMIEASSASSCEQLLLDAYQRTCEEIGSAGEKQLMDDLADAMRESPILKDESGHCVLYKPHTTPPIAKIVNPLGTVVTILHPDFDEIDGGIGTMDFNEDGLFPGEQYYNSEGIFRTPVSMRKPSGGTHKKRLNHTTTTTANSIFVKTVEPNTQLAVKIVNSNHCKTALTTSTTKSQRNTTQTITTSTICSPIISTSTITSFNNNRMSHMQSTNTKSTTSTSGDSLKNTKLSHTKVQPTKKSVNNNSTLSDEPFTDYVNKSVTDLVLEPLAPPTTATTQRHNKNKKIDPIEATVVMANINRIPDFKSNMECEFFDNTKLQSEKIEDSQKAPSKDEYYSTEEKGKLNSAIAMKKIRKPKTKLGVKIAKDENTKLIGMDEESAMVGVVPVVKICEKSLDSDLISSCVNTISFENESLCNNDELLASKLDETPVTETVVNKSTTLDVHYNNNIDILKLSSDGDEEKVECTPPESAESDDSSKVPAITILLDNNIVEDSVTHEPVKTNEISTKRKSKKNKRK